MSSKAYFTGAAAAAIAWPAFAAEPLPPPPPFTWTGLYVGAQIGYVWGRDPVSWAGVSNDDDPAGGTFSQSPQGVIGGAHIGYNFQYNPWLVFGIEGLVDGTSLNNTRVLAVNDFMGDTPGILTATDKGNVQGSIRGRLGVVPWEPVLVYFTGGVAFAGLNTTIMDTTGFFTGVPGTNATFSNTRAGWTIGGGVDYAITPNWSVRAEYRYSNFGHTTDFPFGGQLAPNGFAFLRHSLTENQVQVGFNYRFDWTVPPPPPPPPAPPAVTK